MPGEPLVSKWEMAETKHIVLLFWLMCFPGLYIPQFERSSWWGRLGLIAGSHLLEFFVKIKVLRRAVADDESGASGVDVSMHRGLLEHFILTMVYGYFHWSALEEQQAKARKAQRSA